MTTTAKAVHWAEQGRIPDALIRAGIRKLCRQRLTETGRDDCEKAAELTQSFVAKLRDSPIALATDQANEQHYEVPADFFTVVLGIHRKYSGCYWDWSTRTLDEAEQRALELSCAHADVEDGQQILELGCGWGSLSLWLARHYPNARIVAVSNSNSQRAFIEAQVACENLSNLSVITQDMNRFDTCERFDRVVSVEMFEHMRNWPALFGRVHDWLKPGGRFFMHVFVHRHAPYLFENKDPSDWMSRHFFTGGMMPSDDLAWLCQGQLRLLKHWRWDGRHYQKTANAWLANLDRNAGRLAPVLEQTYGVHRSDMWHQRWRIFFMACAELFGYERGQLWWVSHYLFEKTATEE